LSLTRKPARKRAYRIAFRSVGANLRRTGASDTLTGAASSVEFHRRRVRLRARKWLAQCRMGRKYTCGPRFQSTGAFRIPEFVVQPQSGGTGPDPDVSGRSASRSRRARSPDLLAPQKHWPHDSGNRLSFLKRLVQHIGRRPPAGSSHTTPAQSDQGSSDGPT
jgi:hypothetical protein